jgi:hypothetical protein
MQDLLHDDGLGFPKLEWEAVMALLLKKLLKDIIIWMSESICLAAASVGHHYLDE